MSNVDLTEARRKLLQVAINSGIEAPESVEQTWTTDQMTAEFDVLGFAAPLVVVRRKTDGKRGSLLFRHDPRVYFRWQEDK